MAGIFSRMALGMGKVLDMVLGTLADMVLDMAAVGKVLDMAAVGMVLGTLADMVLGMVAVGMVLGTLVLGKVLDMVLDSIHCRLHKHLCSWQTLPGPS